MSRLRSEQGAFQSLGAQGPNGLGQQQRPAQWIPGPGLAQVGGNSAKNPEDSCITPRGGVQHPVVNGPEFLKPQIGFAMGALFMLQAFFKLIYPAYSPLDLIFSCFFAIFRPGASFLDFRLQITILLLQGPGPTHELRFLEGQRRCLGRLDGLQATEGSR